MKKILFLSSLLWLGWQQSWAQELSGKVVDERGEAVSGAYIYEVGQTVSATSDELGNFILPRIGVGDTLKVSFLGYEGPDHVVAAADLTNGIRWILRESAFDLDQIVVSKNIKSVNQLSSIDLYTNPVNSSQEILQKVPGLFIAQHAGGGKAEQIFLRGFDIDHGTDINIAVDGLPVNMVSHAHGQGYADLHFVIPETVERIDFGKGPYYASRGNFTTAGYVEFQTKEQLDEHQVNFEIGRFKTWRTLAMVKLLDQSEGAKAYIAGEHLQSDGPFESPQDFRRSNVMGKFSLDLKKDGQLTFLASHFQSRWNASGQIPQRAVDQGLISRFGAIDDTEGGNTSRTNLSLRHRQSLGGGKFVRSLLFYSQYDFELFSNFTFFLDDPENGDQIRQHEDRSIVGWESVFFNSAGTKHFELEWQAGMGLRYDLVRGNELAHTLNRSSTLERMALGEVNEGNFYGFANADIDFGKWLINPGLRLDYFRFGYLDLLSATEDNERVTKALLSPKLNVVYSPNDRYKIFAKSGIGFHSNDSRVVVANSGRDILPIAFGVDLGAEWKPRSRLWLNAAMWQLFLQQEFVYVGDAGIVEPSGRSRRVGIDFGLRYQLSAFIFAQADINYTLARAIDEAPGEDYIPLAPDLVSSGGLSFRYPSGISGGLQYRYIKDRAANEDRSIIAEGYFVTDLNVQYQFKKFSIGLTIENLFDVAWNEAQFATESRLANELLPVEELHFTPGAPFFAKVRFGWSF